MQTAHSGPEACVCQESRVVQRRSRAPPSRCRHPPSFATTPRRTGWMVRRGPTRSVQSIAAKLLVRVHRPSRPLFSWIHMQ
ncbi:PilI type IV pilus biogenesis protein [Mesorhizobium sp.]|uniref:PilI type IV pilus biogenesis protein n=1 Tax=Mesorhizobium sp. TaxID=1871066 RepID=UPI000FE300A1|nr:MAG: hypothetical protein EOR40_30420 [Mesorhizobium sp.]TIP15344.1 MAG: hypothetical protein E5X66_30395 [Mesorhizobium sp.]TJV76061.1 MAG: hypothetical protein E5X45_30010 [Mesorhizobium sp.]TJW04527.1 MAG: hypothetical protein E5X42_30200 [Mesorhizobium sp.]